MLYILGIDDQVRSGSKLVLRRSLPDVAAEGYQLRGLPIDQRRRERAVHAIEPYHLYLAGTRLL
jgi:hypothetical protein